MMNKHDFLGIMLQFLKRRRPHGSAAEQAVLDWFCKELEFEPTTGGVIRKGNHYPDIWIVAHADTVGSEGKNRLQIDKQFVSLQEKPKKEVQKIEYEVKTYTFNGKTFTYKTPKYGYAYSRGYGQCLGADDGAGLAIIAMLAYYRRDITLFIPVGEERGGIGSTEMCMALSQDEMPKIVISLDRKGYNEVITHQGASRTCSDKFAIELAQYLPGEYKPSDRGIYTDSATFSEFGSNECTNLSVGYFDHHTEKERVHWTFTYKLARALCDTPFDLLPVEHEPKLHSFWGYEDYYYGYYTWETDPEKVKKFLQYFEEETWFPHLYRQLIEEYKFKAKSRRTHNFALEQLFEELLELDTDAYERAEKRVVEEMTKEQQKLFEYDGYLLGYDWSSTYKIQEDSVEEDNEPSDLF